MRNILGEFGYPVTQPSTLHIDNQSAISVSKNPEHHGRMKHLDLRYYWLRDAVNTKCIALSYIPTAEDNTMSISESCTRDESSVGK